MIEDELGKNNEHQLSQAEIDAARELVVRATEKIVNTYAPPAQYAEGLRGIYPPENITQKEVFRVLRHLEGGNDTETVAQALAVNYSQGNPPVSIEDQNGEQWQIFSSPDVRPFPKRVSRIAGRRYSEDGKMAARNTRAEHGKTLQRDNSQLVFRRLNKSVK